ncbi:sensor histidine kinase [Cellulomonas palmilytica]|uniref:sensor histidine kinase n=1 Tax=Cellulomonas palmilytica TaxID=2608402 RepID=UPI001F19DBC0|nr:sensor histidine kinase [Cellulomonas palmilytica]
MSSRRDEFWRHSMRAWDVAFWVMLAISAAFAVPDAETTGHAVSVLAGFAVLSLAYLALGRRGARRGDARLTQTYLVVLVLVVTFETWAAALGIVLLFVAYSHIWFFALSRLQGVGWTVLLTAGVVVATALRVRAEAVDLPSIAGQATLGMVFSIGLGLWVTYVAEQSEERAVLLDDLRATQAALAASHHEQGVHAERARLAQEIHDTLAQGFTSVVMLTQTASAELDAGRAPAARERLAQIEAVARDNLAEARALVAAFAPPALDDGLAAALHRLGDQLRTQAGLDVRVETDDVGELPQETAVTLLRAAQESLANVRRHAGASGLTVRLGRSSDVVELEVLDDGRGMRDDDGEGNGVRGMRERARAAGGELELHGTPGAGTRVVLRLPTTPDDVRKDALA